MPKISDTLNIERLRNYIKLVFSFYLKIYSLSNFRGISISVKWNVPEIFLLNFGCVEKYVGSLARTLNARNILIHNITTNSQRMCLFQWWNNTMQARNN